MPEYDIVDLFVAGEGDVVLNGYVLSVSEVLFDAGLDLRPLNVIDVCIVIGTETAKLDVFPTVSDIQFLRLIVAT